jgi:hypothetical protein
MLWEQRVCQLFTWLSSVLRKTLYTYQANSKYFLNKYCFCKNERFGNIGDCQYVTGSVYVLRLSLCQKSLLLSHWNFQVSMRKTVSYISAINYTKYPMLGLVLGSLGVIPVGNTLPWPTHDHQGAVHAYSSWELNLFWTIPSDRLCVFLFLGDVFMVLMSVERDCFLTTLWQTNCVLVIAEYLNCEGKNQFQNFHRADTGIILHGRKIVNECFTYFTDFPLRLTGLKSIYAWKALRSGCIPWVACE